MLNQFKGNSPTVKNRDYYRLSSGEKILGGAESLSLLSDTGGFTLTNHRIIYARRSGFGSETVTQAYNVESIDTVEVQTKNEWGTLLFGVLLIPVYGVGLLILLFWYFSREKNVFIKSGRSEMFIRAASWSRDSIQEFVHTLQDAKQARIEELRTKVVVTESRGDAVDKLRDLLRMKDEGLITEEEFKRMKQSLL